MHNSNWLNSSLNSRLGNVENERIRSNRCEREIERICSKESERDFRNFSKENSMMAHIIIAANKKHALKSTIEVFFFFIASVKALLREICLVIAKPPMMCAAHKFVDFSHLSSLDCWFWSLPTCWNIFFYISTSLFTHKK